MSVQQYLRKLSCIVGDQFGNGIEFADFRVQFQVRRGDMQTPNTADVRIFNLSDSTANEIANVQEYTQIALQAGYEGNFGLIFRGIIKQTRLGRIDQKDSYVDITAADGDELYNYSALSLTLAKGSSPSDDIASMMQSFTTTLAREAIAYDSDSAPQLQGNARVRGRVWYGMGRECLRKFAAANGVLWSVQDGRLTLIPQNGYIEGQVPVISRNTGLIGVPEMTAQGLELRVLLNPSIRIGQLIQLQSNAINQYRYGTDLASQANNPLLARSLKTSADGLYYVMSANHSGDTRGNDWYTDLTCLAANASVPKDEAVSAGAIAPEGAIRSTAEFTGS
jgi:hypothetical protein